MYVYSQEGHFCQVDYFNIKILSALITFLTLLTVCLICTTKKGKSQLKRKMIKSKECVFKISFFPLLDALSCNNKAVVHQMDINVHYIKGAIPGSQFYMNTCTWELHKICILTSSKHWGSMISLICSTSQSISRT